MKNNVIETQLFKSSSTEGPDLCDQNCKNLYETPPK